MKSTIETGKEGWYGIAFQFNAVELEALIDHLKALRDGNLDHFHFRRDDFSGNGGIYDVEISIKSDDGDDNMLIDGSPAHY